MQELLAVLGVSILITIPIVAWKVNQYTNRHRTPCLTCNHSAQEHTGSHCFVCMEWVVEDEDALQHHLDGAFRYDL